MSQDVYLFLATQQPLPSDEVFEIVGHENIDIEPDDDGGIQHMVIRWEDGLQVDVLRLEEPTRTQMLDNLAATAGAMLGKRTDKKARKVSRRAERMERVFLFRVSPDWDDARRAQYVAQWIMASDDYAFLVANGAIYNENGNREVGVEGTPTKYFATEAEEEEIPSDAAAARKKRTIKQLKAENVPFIAHLPVVPDEDETTLRPVEDVVRRTVALYLMAMLAEGEFESEAEFKARVAEYDIADAFTGDELAFIANEMPTEDYIIEFSQRWESCWILLWALGMIDYPGKPAEFAYQPRIRKLLDGKTIDELIDAAQLRDKSAILDELDLVYRYHWAAIDAELYGKRIPNGMKLPVLYERHYALNWLIGVADWDDVPTDT